MADLVTTLATQTGIDPETIHKSLGAVLKFLQEHLSSEAFAKVEGALPGAPEMTAAYDAQKESGGLIGAVASLASHLLGGQAGEGANLLEMLSRAGLDVNQIRAFLPRAL